MMISMPSYSRKIEIQGKSAQELYDRVSSDIDRFMDKASLGKFNVQRDPSQKIVTVDSSMVTAKLTCQEGVMVLDAKLSLLATPFRSKIDDGIDRWLKKTFGDSSVS